MGLHDWLVESDPAIRWQVLRDLEGAPIAVVDAERSRVAHEGWGAQLLSRRDDDGQWAGGACFPADHDWSDRESPGQPWTATLHTLDLLYQLGLDPNAAPVAETICLVRANCRWEHDGQPFFAGEVEPCINGRTASIGAYFGEDVDAIVNRLLDDQLSDGGWNCWTEHGAVRSSFHSTICVLEGLLAHEQATGGAPVVAAARRHGEEYLLDRRLMRRLSTGEVGDPAWLQFSFPTQWHYDVLRGLDYFRSAYAAPDPRLDDALHLVRSKRQDDGTWLLENTHPGAAHLRMEDGDNRASRWNTLRALRVLRWSDA